jgi:hypothetical protein
MRRDLVLSVLTPFTIAALGALAMRTHAQQSKAAAPLGRRGADPQLAIYNNPAEFAKLSNAAQNLLVAKYGQLPRVDEKGNLIPPVESAWEGEVRDGRRRQRELVPPGSSNVLGNVLVNDAAGDLTAQDTQSETALVLGSAGRLVSAFNDSAAFNFTDSFHFTGWAYSADDGTSWTDPGTLPGNNDAGDPVLARNATTGRIYLACLFFNGSGINVFRSDDDGVTWLPSVNGTPGGLGFQDKEWIAVDNAPGAGNGNVYLVSRDFGGGDGIFFYRSTDNGATFGPFGGTLIASGASGNVQGAYVVVGPGHEVYCFYYDSSVLPQVIRMRKSTDLGLTFGAPVTVTTITSDQINGNLSLSAGFRSNTFPQVQVNPVSGNLYVAYNDPTAVFGGDRGNILLRQSTDGGMTWSAPMQVNDDATTRAQYFPALVVRPDGAGMAVCWYDNRNDPMDRNIERWGATATIAGGIITFGPNFRLSPSFPPVFGVDPVVNFVYMGDYDQMAADNTTYYTTWGDNRDDSLGAPGRKNANVRIATFSQEGPGALIDLGPIALEGGNLNGRIEPNECNQLFVSLTNSGAQPATGVSAVLSTMTPGVTILDAMQSYPDLNGGDTAANAMPYQISTSPAFVCGTTIQFVLTVTSSAGTGPLGFQMATGGDNYQIAVGAGDLTPGGLDIGNHCDDCVTSVALPFPVTYYDATFNLVNVSSNGNVQFSSNSAGFSNPCLPDLFTSNLIAAHWDDLRTDAGGSGIFRSTLGVAPNRTFVLQWRTTYFSGFGTATFELRLHEDSPSFELVYGGIGQNSASATIGCQRQSGPSATQFSCNQAGVVSNGTLLSFSLPGCPNGDGECVASVCYTLDLESDDEGAPMAHGARVDAEFDGGATFPVTITGSANPSGDNTAAILNSTTGPSSQDPDLLVGTGNILILQHDGNQSECGAGVYCTHNDDDDGGSLSFVFNSPAAPMSLVLVDIDATDPASSVVLTDSNGNTRTYTVPGNWTGDLIADATSGTGTLDLTTLADQPGFASTATASEDMGFDPTAVVRLDVNLGGSGALDDLVWCQEP